jgi:hypothetical protein
MRRKPAQGIAPTSATWPDFQTECRKHGIEPVLSYGDFADPHDREVQVSWSAPVGNGVVRFNIVARNVNDIPSLLHTCKRLLGFQSAHEPLYEIGGESVYYHPAVEPGKVRKMLCTGGDDGKTDV